MTSVDFARVRRLVESAYALPRDARAAFLERECGANRALRTEVDELLAAADSSEHFLDPARPPLDVASLVPPELDLQPGRRIGGFRLLHRIAAGGMGTIWEAEQDEPRRRVALKTLRFGNGSNEAVRRFRHEAEILARLRHPHVAQVFASGVHENGMPWYALEFIEDARSLTEFARARSLDLRQRLALFVDLCDAVQHAHERGVIHRDLKPNNVLVDAEGCVKVIDFGVARMRANDGTPDSFVTEAGRVLGTLPYMSPEQVGGTSDGLDVRSDVYALGVVLFELLTHELPFDVARASLAEAAHVLTTATPPRPSTRSGEIPADVDAIVLKALEKHRERRYASALELAADVQRWLRGEPVEAQQPSVMYQLRMFALRHRVLVSSLAVVIAVLLVATVVSALFALDATRQREHADDAARDAVEQRNVARLKQYTSDLYAAYGALRGLDFATAQQRLESCPEEYHGFEWWHLLRRAQGASWTRAVLASEIRSLVWHPDGTRVYVATAEGKLEVRNPTNGAVIDSLSTGESLEGRTWITPDGSAWISCSPRGRVLVFSTWPLCELRRFDVGERSSVACCLNPSGARIATVSTSGRARLWTLDGERLAEWNTFAGAGSISVSADDAWIAVSGTRGQIGIYEHASLSEVAYLTEHTSAISRVRFSPDGRTMISAAHDQTLRIWDVPSFTTRAVLHGHGDLVWDADIDALGKTLVSVGWDRTLRVWDVETASLRGIRIGHRAPGLAVALSPDGTLAASGDQDAHLAGWRVGVGDPRVTRVRGKWNWTLRVFPDSRSVLAVHGGFATRFQTTSGAVLARFPCQSGEWLSAAISRDGKSVYLGDTRGNVEQWLADGEERVARLHVDESSVRALDLLCDGRRVVAASSNGVAYVLDPQLAAAERVAELGPSLETLSAHPSEPRIALGGRAGKLVIVDAVEKRELASSDALHAEILRAAWSPDGESVALALADGRAIVWQPSSRSITHAFYGHEGAVTDVLFTLDGSRVVTSSRDRTLRFWELARDEEMAAFGDHTNSVEALAVTPDGSTIVSGSVDSTLRWWDAGPKAWQTVEKLKATGKLSRDLCDALRADATLSEPLRAKALELAGEVLDDPSELAREAWLAVREPGAARPTLERAAAAAESASRHAPNLSLAVAARALALSRLDRDEEACTVVEHARGDDRLLALVRALVLARAGRARPDRATLDDLSKATTDPLQIPTKDRAALLDELDEFVPDA
ncbi:MAG: protein kinase [Planctomycetes bacterium]|nr:protein kinase [Planctomycetota bacterium]